MFTKTLNLSQTAAKLRNGEIDLLDFINDLCNRIDKVEPEILSLLPEDNRQGRLINDSKQLLRRYPDKKDRPLFFGIPIGVKDIFRADDFKTRCGSNFPADLFEGKEASCVTRLKNAGALILGKTVTTEFAYFEPGPTKNPNNTNYTPGGSSSGSAAAVAAGFTPFAFGTQTIGSVIRPAAYCGVIGFKPSYRRIATDGVIPFSQSADHIGFFTQDMDGCILAASVLLDNWNEKQISKAIHKPLIIGVPDGKYLLQASEEIIEKFENNLRLFQKIGIEIKRINIFDDIENINRSHRLMVAAEISEVHEKWYAQYKDLYQPHSKQIIEEGQKILSTELEQAKKGRFQLRKQIERKKEENNIDLWVSPSVLTMPSKGLSSTGSPLMSLPWTYAGLPAITVPTGKNEMGLPVGIQFCGSFDKDKEFLSFVKNLLN
jgi:Asp-tRNA(Asn)/Glu-tRNA(Gln) amidotransferase A subunit family amidase